MKQQYLIRLDDACPTMDSLKWAQMEALLDKYGVVPMVGIVPDNHDENLIKQEVDEDFWKKVQTWQDKGWAIAMHGYDHCYISDKGMQGINPMWKRSEFAGVPIDLQKEKIRLGVRILRNHGINPKYFFAPSHTFDENTLVALREESDIRIISDTIGRYPYKDEDFYFIPQITGHCVKMPFDGIYTFCFHPNMMDSGAFERIEVFLRLNGGSFIEFDKINLDKFDGKKFWDRVISHFFFLLRRARGLR